MVCRRAIASSFPYKLPSNSEEGDQDDETRKDSGAATLCYGGRFAMWMATPVKVKLEFKKLQPLTWMQDR